MNSYRKTATLIGILFLICTAATLISFPFSGPILDKTDYLARLIENKGLIVTGALFEFIWAAACAGIAIGLYSVLKKYHEALALGSVAFRVAEGIFVLVGTLSLLALLTLSRDFVEAGAPAASSFQTSGTTLLAVRDWAHSFMLSICFCLGALIYYYLLYKSRLIPRWLSGWGFLGALLSLIATLIAAFTEGDTGFASIDTILNAPIGLNEIVLAIWLIARGFNQSAIVSLSAKHSEKEPDANNQESI